MTRQRLLPFQTHQGRDARANLIERWHAGRADRVEPEDVVAGRRVDHRARLAGPRFEGPDADVGNHVGSDGEPLAPDDLVLRRHLQPETTRGAVQNGGIAALGGGPLERVGARFHAIEVLTLYGNGDQNMAQLHRIALDLVDPDEVIAELRRDRGRDLARLQTAQPLHELRDEARLVLVDPPQVAAALAAYGIVRLAFCDVF